MFLDGCLLKMTLITLGRAEPATIGCISAVDCDVWYCSIFIIIMTFRMPIDLPAILTNPAPIGTSKNTMVVYQVKGNIG